MKKSGEPINVIHCPRVAWGETHDTITLFEGDLGVCWENDGMESRCLVYAGIMLGLVFVAGIMLGLFCDSLFVAGIMLGL